MGGLRAGSQVKNLSELGPLFSMFKSEFMHMDQEDSMELLEQIINTTPSRPESDGLQLANMEKRMNNSNPLAGFPGGNKFMDMMLRKAEGVVWDMMTGRIGIQTDKGIATLNGTGEDAQVELNLMDQFGMAVPAFAQSTPVAAVNVGDLIYFGASDRTGWVIDKIAPADPTKQPKFKLMKVDGSTTSWTAPKVSMLGMESGVMVLRSMLSMLPGGQAGLQGVQGNMMLMMQMSSLNGDEGGFDMEKMLPMMMMSQMAAAPAVVNADGTTTAAPVNPMAQMLPMMMMSKFMGGNNGGSNNGFGGNGNKRVGGPGNGSPFTQR